MYGIAKFIACDVRAGMAPVVIQRMCVPIIDQRSCLETCAAHGGVSIQAVVARASERSLHIERPAIEGPAR